MNALSHSFGRNHTLSKENRRRRLTGGAVQGLDLVKDLADLERELAKKLDEARRSAESRIADAKEEVRRILVDADTRIRLMEKSLEARMTEESERVAKEAQAQAGAEAERICQQADPNIDRAVEFLLSEVLP